MSASACLFSVCLYVHPCFFVFFLLPLSAISSPILLCVEVSVMIFHLSRIVSYLKNFHISLAFSPPPPSFFPYTFLCFFHFPPQLICYLLIIPSSLPAMLSPLWSVLSIPFLSPRSFPPLSQVFPSSLSSAPSTHPQQARHPYARTGSLELRLGWMERACWGTMCSLIPLFPSLSLSPLLPLLKYLNLESFANLHQIRPGMKSESKQTLMGFQRGMFPIPVALPRPTLKNQRALF